MQGAAPTSDIADLTNNGITVSNAVFLGSPGGSRTGLEVWLKADAEAFNDAGSTAATNGQQIQEWHDQSGFDRDTEQITSDNQPTFTTNVINHNPALDFDATDDLLAFKTAFDAGSNFEFFTVVKPDSSSPVGIFDGGPGHSDVFRNHAAGEFEIEANDPGLSLGLSDTQAHLLHFDVDQPGNLSMDYFLDGLQVGSTVSGSTATEVNWPSGTPANLGAISGGSGGYFDGKIAEIILYSTELSSADRAKIQSYLGIKYGIELNQSIAQDYVDSNGSTIWDAAVVGTTYDEDIAAIGQDDNSGLNQTQSKSANSDAIVTIAENGGGMDDGEFLFWSNDGGSNSFSTTDVPTGIDGRLTREWIIEETGEVGSVNISFDLAGITLPPGVSTASHFFLLTDADGTFASGASTLQASSLSNSVVTFTGIHEDLLDDEAFFTLGVIIRGSPGGFDENIHLWYKADAGTSTTTDGNTLTTWSDQSGNGIDATESSNPPMFKNNSTDSINFNPTISFDGSDDQLITSFEAFEGSTDYSFFAVALREGVGANYVLGSNNTDSRFTFALGYSSSVRFRFKIDDVASATSSVPVNSYDDPALTPSLLMGLNDLGIEERDGLTVENTLNNNKTFPDESEYYVGRAGSITFQGSISEVIAYRGNLSSQQASQVESYLAIKYGISLGQNEAAQDYFDSRGNVIWDASVIGTSYDEYITAIGQDVYSGLDQSQSKNSSDDAIVTIAENGGGMDDGEFLFWSNDGESNSFSTTDVPTGIDQRLTREWLTKETGEVGSVDISFDLEGITLPSGVSDFFDFFLLTDDEGTFASGSSTLQASSLSNDVVTFTGINEDLLNDGVFFTLGVKNLDGPAGIGEGIHLWLKADAEAFSDAGLTAAIDSQAVQEWHDQSGNDRDTEQNTADNRPTFTTNVINHNPALDFDATDDLLAFKTAFDAGSDFEFFTVVKPDNSSPVGIFDGGPGHSDVFRNHAAGEFEIEANDPGLSLGLSDTQAHLLHFDVDQPGNLSMDYFLDGLQVGSTVSGSTATEVNWPSGTPANLGAISGGSGGYFDGKIAEIILYSTELSSADRAKIQSYLGIKYGIELDQSIAQNYVDSNGSTIWDAAVVGTTYDEDIAAIGQDDNSGLNQTQSKSSHSDAIVTISENGGGMDDGEFLFWSNDGGSNSFSTTDVPTGIDQRLTREWVIEETGEVGSVDISFDLNGITLPTGVSVFSEFFLLTDDNGTFASGSSTLQASSLSNDVVTFTGINEDLLNDGTLFTLGVRDQTGPVGIASGIHLWLKADAETFSDAGLTAATDSQAVQEWHDQSGNDRDTEQNTADNRPTFTTNVINHNPALDFDATDDLLAFKTAFDAGSNFEFFTVVKPDSSSPVGIFDGGPGQGDVFRNHAAGEFEIEANDPGLSLGLSDTQAHLLHFDVDQPGNLSMDYFLDGLQVGSTLSGSTATEVNWPSGTPANLGAISGGSGGYFDGKIAEIILYSTELSSTDRAKIQSYLGIKYGIELDQSIAQDYVDSNGSTIWDAAVVGTTYD